MAAWELDKECLREAVRKGVNGFSQQRRKRENATPGAKHVFEKCCKLQHNKIKIKTAELWFMCQISIASSWQLLFKYHTNAKFLK